MAVLESGKRNIAILGAGFAGITALVHLWKLLGRENLQHEYQIVLISNRAWHLYTPALYEIAAVPHGAMSSAILKRAICIPIEFILGKFTGARFIAGEIAGMDPKRHTILFRNGDYLPYDYCIAALGAETNDFGIPGVSEYAFGLKTFEDAIRLRNRAEELAINTDGILRIVIVGGGATGVELAAEFVNFFCEIKEASRTPGRCIEEITLLEAGPAILAGFHPTVVAGAAKRLEQLGIRIRTNAVITEVNAREALLKNGGAIPYHLLVWSGGVMPARALKQFGMPLDPKGRLLVNQNLEARPHVWAIGDCAGYTNPATGKPVPGNIPVAERQAERAAKNIVAVIQRRTQYPFRPLKRWPFILTAGGKYAFADLGRMRFSGRIGWFAKQLVQLRYLITILPFGRAISVWMLGLRVWTSNDPGHRIPTQNRRPA